MAATSRYLFETATEADNGQILEILESDISPGSMSMIYTRRPDAVASFKKGGEQTEVLVCRERASGLIIGVWAVSICNMYFQDKVQKTGYLYGFRIRKGYEKKIMLIRTAFRNIFEKYAPVKVWYTSILEENNQAQNFLGQIRRGMPVYDMIGKYNIYAIAAKPGFFQNGSKSLPAKSSQNGETFHRASPGEAAQITAFLNENGSWFDFFPEVKEEDLLHGNFMPSVENFYLLKSAKGKIIAAGAAWNQQEYKQYIIAGYSGLYKWIRPFSFLFYFLGYPALPEKGSVLNFSTLSFFAAQNNDTALFIRFMHHFRKHLQRGSSVIIGLHEGNPLNKIRDSFPVIRYSSNFFRIYPNPEQFEKTKTGLKSLLYFECGRL